MRYPLRKWMIVLVLGPLVLAVSHWLGLIMVLASLVVYALLAVIVCN